MSRCWRQVIVDYFVGPDAADPTKPSDATLAAMQEAKKKPAKYKLAEVLGNLVLNLDVRNSWNAVRSLRSMAATVVSVSAVVQSVVRGRYYSSVFSCLPRNTQTLDQYEIIYI